MSTGLEVCLRSKEYLEQDTGEFDPRGIHWRDVYFRSESETLEGEDVQKTEKITYSLMSSKNSLGRCTRTIFLTNSPVSAVRMLTARYLRILKRTGSPPDPNKPVYELEDGKRISRRLVCKTVQDILETVGVPPRFSGSHSLRRGGSCMYRAAGMADEDVARFGRWTSNAYK